MVLLRSAITAVVILRRAIDRSSIATVHTHAHTHTAEHNEQCTEYAVQ